MLVLLGHQSVGQNLLDGMPVPALLTINEPEPAGLPMAVCAFRVGRNRDPLGKIQHFSDVVAGETYLRMVSLFQSSRSDLVIAHVTVPLQSVPNAAPPAAFLDRLRT